jgi:hypothetical protein
MMNPPRQLQVCAKQTSGRYFQQWHDILRDRWQETLQAIEERSSQIQSHL